MRKPSIPPELHGVLVSTPETLGGSVRFVNSRVPVQALLDTLDEGGDIDQFLNGWPDVPREHAEAVIKWRQQVIREAFGLDPAV
jgi:uncharacterized protein (DUF433 family)